MDQLQQFQMSIQWVGDLTSPPTPVNQFLLIGDSPVEPGAVPDLHVLNFGLVSAPAIAEELTPEILAQLAQQPLPILPVGRFTFSAARLRQLRDTITTHLEKLEGGA